jgi:hypothetical protein
MEWNTKRRWIAERLAKMKENFIKKPLLNQKDKSN